jgi:hypothetical protein
VCVFNLFLKTVKIVNTHVVNTNIFFKIFRNVKIQFLLNIIMISGIIVMWASPARGRRQLMRVNSVNVLDEGLRIGGRGYRMNSKVKVSQTRCDYVCIENKRGTQLAQSQSVLGRPLLAPIYRWSGIKDPVRFNTNYSVRMRYQLVFRLCL